MHTTFLALVFFAVFIRVSRSSGVFELRFLEFENPMGRDSRGNCCSGESLPAGGCSGTCTTKFRVCLKHYQAQVDTTSPCTYGDVVTPVLGHNEIRFANGSAVYSLQFPFEFAWPGTFSLIIEAWNDVNSTATGLSENKRLIAQLRTQKWLLVGSEWSETKETISTVSLKYDYRVTCKPNYYGSGCATFCRPRDDSFGHYSCSENGTRVCLDGWEDDYCAKAKCLPGCNAQHGSCSKPNECVCQNGWKGRLCDQCKTYPGCEHGSCKTAWDCVCEEGWGGLFCNLDLNFCTNRKPCQNNGTCFNTGAGSFTCSCQPGFTGIQCQTKIDGCSHNPCQNGGVCFDSSTGGYKCDCPKNWDGEHCEISAVTCGDLPCSNGGTCEDIPGGYKCRCPPGFTGSDCQTEINLCSSNPCANGGTCLLNGESYDCSCPSGFKGPNCQVNIDDCIDSPCLNGGTCLDGVNSYRCQCVPGYVGKLCESEVDYCLTKPCANGGTCLSLLNDFRCTCPPGFSGKSCSVDINECRSNPCRNGATCVDRLNSFRCDCTDGWTGPTCSERPGERVGNISRHISARDDPGLSAKQILVIATLSVAVPLVVCVAAVLVCVMKQRRALERRKADEEARRQNERNAVHSSAILTSSKHGDAHMIKNTWSSPCIKNSDECSVTDGWDPPVYALHRSRSQKQLNTEVRPPSHHRTSCKDIDNLARTDKRVSTLSVDSPLCHTSDPSQLKRPLDRDTFLKPPPSIYVIDDHMRLRQEPQLPATQV